MKVLDIKGIIFDYGGTLDTKGDHWSEVLWQGYEHFGIGVADDEEVEPGVSIHKQAFRDAYVYGERALAVNPIVTPDFHFEDILREKLILELNFLAGKELLETGKDDSEKQAKFGNPGKILMHRYQKCHLHQIQKHHQKAFSSPFLIQKSSRLQWIWLAISMPRPLLF